MDVRVLRFSLRLKRVFITLTTLPIESHWASKKQYFHMFFYLIFWQKLEEYSRSSNNIYFSVEKKHDQAFVCTLALAQHHRGI